MEKIVLYLGMFLYLPNVGPDCPAGCRGNRGIFKGKKKIEYMKRNEVVKYIDD